MKIEIRNVKELGAYVRAMRKHGRVRQDDLAAIANVSRQFAIDVEHGKPTVQFDRTLRLLHELGIPLLVDVPEQVVERVQRDQAADDGQASPGTTTTTTMTLPGTRPSGGQEPAGGKR